MKTKTLLFVVALFASASSLLAQGTAFTYQGKLNDGGAAASGAYDLRFTLYDSAAGGSAVGGPMTNSAVAVSSGLFTATLDFGAGVFTGTNRWLEIAVRTNGAAADFTALAPRQPLTSTPYAIRAADAGNAATATVAGSVGVDAVATSGLQMNAVTSDKIANGTIMPGDLNSTLLSNTFWRLNGNAGTAPGPHFLGTTDGQPLELRVANDRVFRFEPAFEVPNVIGGSRSNSVASGIRGATIAGGGLPLYPHSVFADYSAIGGGTFHIVSGAWGTIAGGRDNRVHAESATVAGGWGNVINSNSLFASIGGGIGNSVSTNSAGVVIGGGGNNRVNLAGYATISGGTANQIAWNAHWSVISGGGGNVVSNDAFAATIGGGSNNRIEPNASYAVIAGGDNNRVASNAFWATISGGFLNTNSGLNAAIGGGKFNSAVAEESTIAGGAFNKALGFSATIGGGGGHRVDGLWSVVAGGQDNVISSNGSHLTVGGGYANRIADGAVSTTISGGRQNQAQSNVSAGVIGGGEGNTIGAAANFATISGGWSNRMGTNAVLGTIAGGYRNYADAYGSTISGGSANTNSDNQFGTIPGGYSNLVSGDFAFAAGQQARALHDGAFVWADSTPASFSSTAANEFAVRASGGVRFVTGGVGMSIDGQPVLSGGTGPGSGLNADLLDGLNSTSFASASHNHYGQIWSGSAFHGLEVATSDTGTCGIAALLGRYGLGTFISICDPVAVWGDAEGTVGVLGTTDGTGVSARGVYGRNFAPYGVGPGVEGETSSTNGYGVYGVATATTGVNHGVFGASSSASGIGVRGVATRTSGFTYGVYGDADSPDGIGVYGKHDASSGTEAGVEGETDSTTASAAGVVGRVTSTAPGSFSAGVRGINNGTGGNGIGVWGSHAGGGWGVRGTSVSGVGVHAQSTSGNPIEAYGSGLVDREFYVSNTGSVFADGTFNAGGADFAEMLSATDGLEAGDVLVIEEDGRLARSTEPKQENVAGVYSTKPGFMGGAHEEIDQTGKVPLAIVGVVPVKVTNENGAIKPGNLLVTSSTPGHAMKASVDRQVGTVIGKALGSFDGAAAGVIQMLVLLQ
jgi:hypothetical protein